MVVTECPCCQEGIRWWIDKTRGYSPTEIFTLKELTDERFKEEMEKASWHCEDCWNHFHNGLRDKDYVPFEERFGIKEIK